MSKVQEPVCLPKELDPTIVSLIALAHDCEVVEAWEEENYWLLRLEGKPQDKYDFLRSCIHNYCNNFKKDEE